MYTVGKIDVNVENIADDMICLYDQLSPGKNKVLCRGNLSDASPHYLVFGASTKESGRLVSMAVLSIVFTPEKCFGQIHDVVTDKSHRGRKFGRNTSLAEEVMKLLVNESRSKRLKYLELTSRPNREEANRLYQRLGFKLVAAAVEDGGTNLYRLHLE